MATLVNVTNASQIANVEINNRELTVLVERNTKSVEVVLETRGNIAVDISRAVSITGVQNIIAGTNINVANSAGNVTVSLNTVGGINSVGNISAPWFIGNVVGNISGNIVVPGNTTDMLYNNDGNIGASDNFTFNPSTNNVTLVGNMTATRFSGNGSQLSSLTGANVTGTVANATHATQANYANTANAVAGANVSGTVANATYAISAGSAGSATTAVTVTANAQPNITSLGTLSSLSINGTVTGNLIPSANVTYSLGNNSNRFNDLYLSGSTIYIGDAEISASGTNLLMTGANLTGDINTTGNANITKDLTVSGNGIISGNFTVSGNTFYTNVETLVIEDPIIEQGGGPNGAPLTNNDGKDRGELLHYYTTEPVDAFMGWDNSGSEFIFGSNVTNTNEVITVNTYGNIHVGNANLGNLATANYINATSNINSNLSIANKFIAGVGGDEYHGYGFSGESNSNTAICLTATDEITIYNNATETLTLYANNYSKFYGNIESVNADLGNLATANYLSGTLTTESQPNINEVGTLVNGLTLGTNTNLYADVLQPTTNGDITITNDYLPYGGGPGGTILITNQDYYGQAAVVIPGGNLIVFDTTYLNGALEATGISNITNIYTSNLTVDVANIHIPGGDPGYVLSTNGLGNLTWTSITIPTGDSISNGTSNVSIPTANGNVNTSVGGVANVFVVTTTGANVTGNLSTSGQITSTGTGNGSDGGGQIFLNGSGNNRIDFNTNGTGAPTDTTRSAGTKVVLYPALSGTQTDYAIGIDAATMWSSVPVNSDSFKFKWYGNTTEVANLDGTGNFQAVGNITGNSLQLRTTTGVTTASPGQMFWDATEQTVSLGMNNGVQQQIGLENYILVKANSAITNGQVVMFVGVAGERILAAPANMSSAGFKPTYIIGMATQDIANAGTGYITTFGTVHDINTNAYNAGDILYVDPASTTGGFTATEPTAPNYHITIGAVTKKSATGHIQVRVTILDKVGDLSDVTLTTPAAGEALIYTSSNTWVNGNSNYANTAGTVVTGAQPNITSTGTLTSLTVTGKITSNGVSGGALGVGSTSNYYWGNPGTGGATIIMSKSGSVANVDFAGDVIIGGAPATAVANLGVKGNINFVDGSNVSIANIILSSTSGNLAINTPKLSLGSNSVVKITGGTSGQVLSTDGLGNLSWATGGGGTPGGNTTELQFNNAGAFGGISTVTYASGNLSLGAVANVKMTGGSSNLFVRTDGAGNLSFQAITSNLTVGTRVIAVNIGITNYTMNVEARTGNVTVNVN